MTVSQLRQQFPTFTYSSYAYSLTAAGLHLEFTFKIGSQHQFHPTLEIYDITADHLARLSPELIEQYVFHLGLIEMFSYWKTTCSPEIVIEAGSLDTTQIAWWHNLLLHGLGEFFFVNQIDFTPADFVKIRTNSTSTATAPKLQTPQPPQIGPDAQILIPIGGGKDSVASLELLKAWATSSDSLTAFHVNPARANQETANISGLAHQYFVRRHLDPLLTEMNSDGFLNGHTPFSALMAFLSTFVAHLTNHAAVAVSNERSSNEGNLEFLGRDINHQYSKSYEFESAFQAYAAEYLPGSPWYFSLLRPWYELQIARYFAQFPKYQTAFRSCNRGKKTNSWCGECSKCLFAYLILAPFIGADHAKNLFGKDLLADENLLPIAQELVGYAPHKPLECVGTKEESLIAVYLCREWYTDRQIPLPTLLQLLATQILEKETNLADRAHHLLTTWNDEHSVPSQLIPQLERQTYV